jgi:hypothetical protein
VLDEGRMPGPEFARGPIKEVAWNYGGFACDAHFVFYDDMLEGKPCVLRGADAAQFAVLAHGFGRDSKTVYYRKSRVKSAVSETFQILNQFYSTDGRKFFYMERAIANADPHSFEVLADCWARDGKHAFFQDGAVANADAATFGIVNQSFARDANHVFGWTGCIIDRADPELFEQIDDSLFYRDNRGVYFGGYPSGWLEGADPATFQVGPNCNEGHDREWVYQGKERKGPRQTDEPRK